MSTPPPPLRELTLDEAIHLAMALAPDGERVAVHREGCAIGSGGACSCEPDVVVVRRGEG